MLRPSRWSSGRSGSPAMSRSVGKRSVVVAGAARVPPPSATPGHRTMSGMRTPPSYCSCLPPRNFRA